MAISGGGIAATASGKKLSLNNSKKYNRYLSTNVSNRVPPNISQTA